MNRLLAKKYYSSRMYHMKHLVQLGCIYSVKFEHALDLTTQKITALHAKTP